MSTNKLNGRVLNIVPFPDNLSPEDMDMVVKEEVYGGLYAVRYGYNPLTKVIFETLIKKLQKNDRVNVSLTLSEDLTQNRVTYNGVGPICLND